MISTIFSMLLGNVVPQLANGIKGIFELKQDRADKEHELALGRLRIELEREKLNIDKEAAFVQAEATTNQAIANIIESNNEANTKKSQAKTGIKWVDSLETIVRNAFGLVACAVMLFAVKQALEMQSPIWQAAPLWDLIGTIVGYYVGYGTSAFSQKKVNK